MLTPAQRAFTDLLHQRAALKFGDFTLKSGRKSPYFINTGCFNQGGDLERLGAAYAATIRSERFVFNDLRDLLAKANEEKSGDQLESNLPDGECANAFLAIWAVQTTSFS